MTAKTLSSPPTCQFKIQKMMPFIHTWAEGDGEGNPHLCLTKFFPAPHVHHNGNLVCLCMLLFLISRKTFGSVLRRVKFTYGGLKNFTWSCLDYALIWGDLPCVSIDFSKKPLFELQMVHNIFLTHNSENIQQHFLRLPHPQILDTKLTSSDCSSSPRLRSKLSRFLLFGFRKNERTSAGIEKFLSVQNFLRRYGMLSEIGIWSGLKHPNIKNLIVKQVLRVQVFLNRF